MLTRVESAPTNHASDPQSEPALSAASESVTPGSMTPESVASGSVTRDRGKSQNPLLWSVVGTVLGLGLLYAATRKVDLAALLMTLESVHAVWLPVILAVTVSFVALKTWRWQILLRFLPATTFRQLHSAVYVGLAVNFVIAHVGEFARTMIVARRRSASFSAVLASVLVERGLDFIALLVLLVMAGAFSPGLPELVRVATTMTAAVVVMALAGLFLLLRPPRWFSRLIEWITHSLPGAGRDWLRTQLARFRLGLASVKDGRLMTVAIVASVVQWSLVVLAIWCSGMAVGQHASLMALAVTFVLIVLGLTLPNSPMQIGTTQLAFVIGFGIDGVGATPAVAASIAYTVFLIIPVMLIGAVCLVRGKSLHLLRLR